MANIIITGANRGLGHEMVKELAEEPPIKPLRIFACARRSPSNVTFKTSPDASVEWQKLDIADAKSVTDLASAIKQSCPEGVDILINNAGINRDPPEGHGKDQAKETIAINYDGTLRMAQAFVPLMRRPGLKELGTSRIVNVSSVGGKLSWVSSDAQRRAFKESSTIDEVQALRDDFLKAVDSGTEKESGWPRSKNYCVSKSLTNAGTQAMAADNKDLLINCCCPGWVQTDMGGLIGSTPAKTLEEGARVPLNLAFGPIKETGKYFKNPSVSDTGKGQVSDW